MPVRGCLDSREGTPQPGRTSMWIRRCRRGPTVPRLPGRFAAASWVAGKERRRLEAPLPCLGAGDGLQPLVAGVGHHLLPSAAASRRALERAVAA
ncbi:hypothetical protein U9M48_010746 [Paspalum notatum var. saurae]|uniref:Uncharacterized protein n=1 Tax=Paspalum notatum var. saurae TaxID=547442 RepID=A0AAQ3SU03_PASNO